MGAFSRFIAKIVSLSVVLELLLSTFSFTSTYAFDPLDPNGNITIKWDVMSWTPDGYVALVTISNFQHYRHIQAPGWSLGWKWAGKEVIWGMAGAQATEQGNCSKYNKSNIPHSCKKDPIVMDLLPSAPYNQQIEHCCKGGVISSWIQDPGNALSSFQVTVGEAGTNNNTLRIPQNFTFKAPGNGYTCGRARIVRPTRFVTSDGRRITQAFLTWDITCTYSLFMAKTSGCCVSFSSFYNDTILSCPKCSCSCLDHSSRPRSCVKPNSLDSNSVVLSEINKSYDTRVQCTSHMCPIEVHWQVMDNYEDYWRVKITITNFNYHMNYSQWNLVVQHHNFDNFTKVFRFSYKPLTSDLPYLNDTAMLWGENSKNDLLKEAGKNGNVQSEIMLKKDKSTLSFDKGWAFPRGIHFNGDSCFMPPPDAYPFLPDSSSSFSPSFSPSSSPSYSTFSSPLSNPNSSPRQLRSRISLFSIIMTILLTFALFDSYG